MINQEILNNYSRISRRYELLGKNLPDEIKFTLMSVEKEKNNTKIEYCLCNNNLVKLDAETAKTKKITEYIYSRFDPNKYIKEKNSVIYCNMDTSLVFDLAVKENSDYRKEIFSNPHFAFAIINSDRTREMYLKNFDSISFKYTCLFLIDLKSKLLMIIKHNSGLHRDILTDKMKIILPSHGKFVLGDIEFDSKNIF